ncbi:MAG: hypothetical protein ACP5SD_06230 [Elusimicrobiales bacterium]|nr:hypothetical protein [Elusimicrobiales bacterium]HOL61832.1 hypothetical protein [Elusimicrobiales bacterium]HPO94586.1 hypothetical protein [Elusimicrobiales bacterium]
MKYIAAFIFLCSNVYSEDYYLSVNSKVKSIKIYNHSVYYKNKKAVIGDVNSLYAVYYDEFGRVIEEAGGKNDKDISWKKKYVYEKDEKKIKKYCKEILSLDDSGKEIKKICSDDAKKISEIKLEKMSEDEILGVSICLNDNMLNVCHIFDSNYFPEEKIVKKFDDKGSLKEEIRYDKNQDVSVRKNYEINKLSAVIKSYDKDNILKEVLSREYKVDGIIRKETISEYTFSQNLSSRREIYYNGYGLKEEEKLFDSNGVFYKDYVFEYELDSKGNWIKEIKYSRDIESLEKKPDSAIKRAIEYR